MGKYNKLAKNTGVFFIANIGSMDVVLGESDR